MAKDYADAEFLEYVVKSLVDEPDKVEVERKVDEMGVLLTLKVSAPDMGKIIGRNGNTAKAIRTLLRVVGMKNNARVNLKVEEPEGGRGPRSAYGGERAADVGERTTTVDQALEDL
ncbi:MAG: KH domain-containing protein, partial [Patescibacteria group bacterium]